jgi:hypothetical protein
VNVHRPGAHFRGRASGIGGGLNGSAPVVARASWTERTDDPPASIPVGGRLLWLNGPFGVGKSTVTRLLHARRGGVVIETAGLGGVLGGLGIGETAAGLGLWLGKIAGALAAQGSGVVAMLPLTVYRSGSVETVLGALAMGGTDVSHVVLTCHKAQLAARIHRGPFDDETKRSHLAQLTPSLAGLAFIAHDLEVDTTYRSAADVAEAVSQLLDERGWRDWRSL